MESFTNFPIEFYNEANDDSTLYVEAEDRLRRLAEGHQDITGANVKITQPAAGRQTPFVFEATVVLYTRPTYITATEKSDSAAGALNGALRAAERQVRQKRDKLRNH